jgi:hypothetical protein
MVAQHKIDDLVKAYLLGTLEPRQAAAVEQRYFLDRDYFRTVGEAEIRLIEDYLENRLMRHEKRSFEQRYLQIPDLNLRVEEVRERLGRKALARETPPWFIWRPYRSVAVAAAALTLLIGGGITYSRLPRSGSQPEAIAGKARVRLLPALSITLSPGLVKGAGVQSPVIAPPDAGAQVRLSLELPGRYPLGDYQVSLEKIEPDGGRRKLWMSPNLLRSVSASGGSVVSTDVKGDLLRTGEYIVQAIAPGGETVGSYFFRVGAPE